MFKIKIKIRLGALHLMFSTVTHAVRNSCFPWEKKDESIPYYLSANIVQVYFLRRLHMIFSCLSPMWSTSAKLSKLKRLQTLKSHGKRVFLRSGHWCKVPSTEDDIIFISLPLTFNPSSPPRKSLRMKLRYLVHTIVNTLCVPMQTGQHSPSGM